MNLTLIGGLAAGMMLAGLAFIYLLLRRNARWWPEDSLQWAGVALSALLVAVAGYGLVLALTYEPYVPTTGTATVVEDQVLDEEAQNFRFRLVDSNETRALEDYEGQVVLLNFWATWCAPCLEEMPALSRLQTTFADRGLVVLTVSDEAPAELAAFEERMPIATVSGYLEDVRELPQPYRQMLDARPMTFLIDAEGRIRRALIGSRDFATFADLVAPYLDDALATTSAVR